MTYIARSRILILPLLFGLCQCSEGKGFTQAHTHAEITVLPHDANQETASYTTSKGYQITFHSIDLDGVSLSYVVNPQDTTYLEADTPTQEVETESEQDSHDDHDHDHDHGSEEPPSLPTTVTVLDHDQENLLPTTTQSATNPIAWTSADPSATLSIPLGACDGSSEACEIGPGTLSQTNVRIETLAFRATLSHSTHQALQTPTELNTTLHVDSALSVNQAIYLGSKGPEVLDIHLHMEISESVWDSIEFNDFITNSTWDEPSLHGALIQAVLAGIHIETETDT